MFHSITHSTEPLSPLLTPEQIFELASGQTSEFEEALAQQRRANQLPLYRSPTAPRPYPFAALGSILGGAALALHEAVQAPDAACAQSVLAAAALVTQPLANVCMDGRAYPLSLYLVTIAGSGERKSGVDRIVLKPIRDHQQRLLQEYGVAKQAYDLEVKRWSEPLPLKGKPVRKLALPKELPEKPCRPFLLVSEPTIEGLIQQLREGYPSIGLFSDEAGGFLGGYSNREERRMHATASLCKLWDGDPLDRVRRTDESSIVYDRRMSMHMMGQEMLLDLLVQDRMSEGLGLLSRCLIAYPASMLGRRTYFNGDVGRHSAVQQFQRQCQHLLGLSLGPSGRVPSELALRNLPLSTEARIQWIAYHNDNERKLTAHGVFQDMVRLASKAPEHVLRIAGVLSVFEDPKVTEVPLEALQRAVILTEWYLQEALRLRATACVPQPLQEAEKLLDWLRERGKRPIWIGEVYRLGPAQFRKAEDARRALRKLAEHGWVKLIPGGCEIDRVWRSEVWEVVE